MSKLCIRCGKYDIDNADLQVCRFCYGDIKRYQEKLEKKIAKEPMSNERVILILKNCLGIAPNEELDNMHDVRLDNLLNIATYAAIKALEKEAENE